MPRKSKVKDFWSFVDKSGECWLWMDRKSRDGYGLISIKGRDIRCHRFSYEQANGQIPPGNVLLHSCDTPACINPAHLRPGTNADNQKDCVSKNRHAKGTGLRTAKLTEAKVLEIRSLYEPHKFGSNRLGKMFGVSQQLIMGIVHRTRWKHV